MSIVYLNGEFMPKGEASISVDDRGFLLSDGVYEVTPFYGGVGFCLDRHLVRLERSLRELGILFDTEGLTEVHHRLVAENQLENEIRALVYLQVTRGVAPRTHYFPVEPVRPTVYAFAKPWERPPEDVWSRGFTAITVPDERWLRVDIKTISLLANALAFQAARDAGADDALLVRNGVAIEGAHQNFFAVFDGTLVTHPESNLILPGITRNVVLELARERGIRVEQRPIRVGELFDADELFFTGTTGEVRPCVQVDGESIGSGLPGDVTVALSQAFLNLVQETKEGVTAVG
ncbi:MAG: aminotransferase class IV [Gemmatimonadetes bacterium]|nr:aminotransferase class IV [Gemmatimonadota bacterium]